MAKQIIKRANRILTNNFLGNMGTQTVGNATQNHFRGNIENTHTSLAATVALLPGHFPTWGVDVTADGPAVNAVVHSHDKSELTKAGHVVDAIWDDATIPFNGAQIRMAPADPVFTIRSFREYIKHNALLMTSMTLHANDVDAYGGNLKVQKTNPFNRPAQIPIELNKFFNVDQFQDNKINVSFEDDILEFSDDVLIELIVPSNSKVGVTFRFAAA